MKNESIYSRIWGAETLTDSLGWSEMKFCQVSIELCKTWWKDYLLAQLSGLILQLPRKSHVSDAIRCQLHWLDGAGLTSRSIVRFKLCIFAHRCIHRSAPSYLTKYCIPVSSIAGESHLRSAASGDLFILVTNSVEHWNHLRLPVLLYGTVLWQNSMTKASFWWRSRRNWKLIYLKPIPKLLCDLAFVVNCY